MSRIFWKRVISKIHLRWVISGKRLAEGYRIPRGWGVSYLNWDLDFTVIHPIPLNYIVAATRWLTWKIRIPYFEKKIQRQFLESYNRGFDHGWDAKKRVDEVAEDRKRDKEKRERGT